jgi:hypothetical protein
MLRLLHLLLRTALLVGVLLLAATTQAAEVVVVDDTTFDEGDWKFVKLPTQPDECLFLHDPTGITFCGQQSDESSDGDDRSFGGLSEITGEGVVTTDLIVGAHVEEHLAYSPETAGAVIHLDAQFELKNLGATQNVTSTIRGHLIVEQAGSLYLSQQNVRIKSTGSPAGFLPFIAAELDANDFSRITAATIDPTSHPDFSTTGAPLHFGFGIDLRWNAELPDNIFVTDFLVRQFRIDEFTVTVTSPDAMLPALPPATRLLLILALCGGAALVLTRAHQS